MTLGFEGNLRNTILGQRYKPWWMGIGKFEGPNQDALEDAVGILVKIIVAN